MTQAATVKIICDAKLRYIEYNYVEQYDEACYHVDQDTVDIVVLLVEQVKLLKELSANKE